MLDQLQAVKTFEWITLAAIILGPILAVVVTRRIDAKREARANRLAIFKTLMRTRGTKIHHEHVGALNLVEIEFYNEGKVADALQKYFEHLNNGTEGTDADRWLKRSDHLFTKLLSEMARSLGYGIEQLQILTGGYVPKGWEDAENRHSEMQKKIIELLHGKRTLPVTTYAVQPALNAGNDDAPRTMQIAVPPGFPPVP